MQNVHFTPSQIARMLGVNESTIKRWVDRGMLRATKTPGGHRRISQRDLTEFRKNHETNKGKTYTLRKPRIITDSDSLWKDYFTLLEINQAKQAEEILINAYIRNMSIVKIIESIVLPTLQNIGAQWRAGKLEIHDEHRMTFYIREHLMALSQMIPETKNAPSAILACMAGDWHEIPLQVSGLILKSLGWNPIILGVNTPEPEILAASQRWDPRLVVVVKIYTKNRRKENLIELENFAHKNKTLLAYGGNGWSKKWRQEKNSRRKYVKYFEDIESFTEGVKSLR